MSTQNDRLPLSPMNRLLRSGLKRLKQMTLSERIDIHVRANLMTEAEAAAIRSRLSDAELAAKPGQTVAQ